ncbi:DUF6461 domain-containing protein [Nonomuraea candida]|uniref:DUF6461 domain-containing protein n=1 Tax=Nonomuraea candida TaxID=359159 RepID=UPI0005BCDF53|nr:DUF6461 domain-containing protein [Nonomuraea candida]
MDTRERLFDLLVSYEESVGDGFVAAWAEGLEVEEVARRIGAEASTATPCTFEDYAVGLEESHRDLDGVVLVRQVGNWVQVLQPYMNQVWDGAVLRALSEGGGRALHVGWHAHIDARLRYAIGGRIVASMPLTMGDVPEELEPYAEGLRFGLEDPTDPECVNPDDPITESESISSALVVAGRITGHELSDESLLSTHTRYVIRG